MVRSAFLLMIGGCGFHYTKINNDRSALVEVYSRGSANIQDEEYPDKLPKPKGLGIPEQVPQTRLTRRIE